MKIVYFSPHPTIRHCFRGKGIVKLNFSYGGTVPITIDEIFSNTGVERLAQLITPLVSESKSPAIGKFGGGQVSVEEFIGFEWESSHSTSITAPNTAFVTGDLGGWISTITIKELKEGKGQLALHIENGKAVLVWHSTELRLWHDFTYIVAGPDLDDPAKTVAVQISIGEPLPEPTEIALDALPEIYRCFSTITIASAKRLGFEYARVELIPP